MKKVCFKRLLKLLPKKNIAFSWCACGTLKHIVHCQALKKSNRYLINA